MAIKIVSDAKKIMARAWSFRLAILSAALSSVDVAMPYMAPDHQSRAFAGAAAVVAMAAALARVVAQQGFDHGDS